MHVHDDASRTNRGEMLHCSAKLALECLLDSTVDRQDKRLASSRLVGQIFVKSALSSRGAPAIDVGETQNVGAERRLGVQAVRFALQVHARLTNRVDGFNQLGRGATAKEKERLARTEHGEILVCAMLGHQLGETLREREFVADDLGGMDRDRPRIDCPG